MKLRINLTLYLEKFHMLLNDCRYMKYILYVFAIVLIVFLSANPTFSQENQMTPSKEATESYASAVKEKPAPETDEISIYGEVQGTAATTNSLSVQYYDYDTDEEKTIDVALTKDTRLENAASITDIKNGDWVDVTYMISDNKNIAKSVAVEKEETGPEEVPEAAPGEQPKNSSE